MNKNWYAVFTKNQCEKKVAAQLSKKKIVHFLPFNRQLINSQNNRKRISLTPLFTNIVFAYLSPAELSQVRQTAGVANFAYWLNKPVVINVTEIENIELLVNSYFNIKLNKTAVNPLGNVKITKEPSLNVNSGLETSNMTRIKVNLPTLGFCLSAETNKNSIDVQEIDFENSKFLLQ